MGSIRVVYDMEGDILDVDFRLTGEKPRQTEVVKLLTREPLKCLLTCLDEKASRFQVIEPKVKELATEPIGRSASA